MKPTVLLNGQYEGPYEDLTAPHGAEETPREPEQQLIPEKPPNAAAPEDGLY